MNGVGLLFVVAPYALALSNPPLVSYSTYLGPSSGSNSVAVDRAGNLYVSGITEVPWFPCDNLPPPDAPSDVRRGAVTKLRPNGDGIVWTRCFSGQAAGVAVDDAGSAYVISNDGGTATVTKLTASDAKTVYTTSIPAAVASAIAVDHDGNAYVTGGATASFATTPGAFQNRPPACTSTSEVCTDGFVLKLGPTGSVQYATFTYTGGSANRIAVDSQKATWITGHSRATVIDRSFINGFILKLDSSGSKRLVINFVRGGIAYRIGYSATILGLTLDLKDAVYVAGTVPIPAFTTTPGALLPRPGGSYYGPFGFALKLDSAGNTVYSTFLGEIDRRDVPGSVGVDAAGNAYFGLIVQDFQSSCTTVRTRLTVINADGSRVLASTALPAPVIAMTMDRGGAAYVVGVPDRPESFPFLATPGAYLTQSRGYGSVFAAKLDFSQPAAPTIDCVVNAASMAVGRDGRGPNGAVAPGEIVTLFGSGFLPRPQLRVDFDGMPAPILYSDQGQINTVVPFGVKPQRAFTIVSVRNGTQIVGPLKLPIGAASPGLFGISGTEQLAALNQDGSVNSSTNPAARGSTITVFMTGAGAYDLEIGDGELGPMLAPFPAPILGVGASVYSKGEFVPGRPARVLFAGQPPGLVAGVVQVNLQIPEDLPPGSAGIVLSVGPSSTFPFRPQYITVR